MADEWDHLLPLVDALVASGNELVDGGFRPNQGGSECCFRLPLDPSVVSAFVEADEHVAYDQAADAVHCRHCWAAILGGDAVARSRRHGESWKDWDQQPESWKAHAVWDIDGWRYEP
jgi:hypothetical protein